MTKKKQNNSSDNFLTGGILKDVQSCRPLRLFINKQRKKGKQDNPLILRSKYLQLSSEKQGKYIQKSITKYIELLDEKGINEHVQIEGKLFDNVLSKREQKVYFDSLDAPQKPFHSAVAYYTEEKKQENNDNPRAWKDLDADERKKYSHIMNNAKAEYASQVKNFADNLPDRLKSEYLSFVNQMPVVSNANEENKASSTIRQRRKSVQPVPENFQTVTSECPIKLTRSQLNELHKCQPQNIYFEKKVADDDKPNFANSTARNAYIRTIFNQLSEKKRHKFILKSTKLWEEFLESNPSIVENQIPTIHLLLSKNDDILYYFSSLGLPTRPATTATHLYNQEREQNNLQQYWSDLPQTTKDEYIKRLAKIKNDYYQLYLEFVEKTLPSVYFRLEFFRNVKFAAKDYEVAIKDRVHEIDNKQSKITQYLHKENRDVNEFVRIQEQLLTTNLTNQQRNLVDRLGQIMKKYINQTGGTKKANNATGTTNSKSSGQKANSDEVIVINGIMPSDNEDEQQNNEMKKKKKRKKQNRDQDEHDEIKSITSNHENEKQSLVSPVKKRK